MTRNSDDASFASKCEELQKCTPDFVNAVRDACAADSIDEFAPYMQTLRSLPAEFIAWLVMQRLPDPDSTEMTGVDQRFWLSFFQHLGPDYMSSWMAVTNFQKYVERFRYNENVPSAPERDWEREV